MTYFLISATISSVLSGVFKRSRKTESRSISVSILELRPRAVAVPVLMVAVALIYRDFDLVYQLFGCPPDSQAVRRTRLSNILACCVAAELREMGYSDSDRPHQESSVPLTLQYEKYLKYKVKYKRQARLLQGYCDYSLWYGYGSGSDEEVHDLGLNLIVFEQRYASTGMAPCLAYMAMVHDIRKRAGKPDSTVYGLSTDSAWFFFQRIDNQGRVS